MFTTTGGVPGKQARASARKAVATCEAAIGINPAKDTQFVLLARAQGVLGDVEAELQALDAVLSIEPRHQEARARASQLRREL
eukprot:SAG22_NODE_254_length_13588_cov_10.695678_2_plen_83_part_00